MHQDRQLFSYNRGGQTAAHAALGTFACSSLSFLKNSVLYLLFVL